MEFNNGLLDARNNFQDLNYKNNNQYDYFIKNRNKNMNPNNFC